MLSQIVSKLCQSVTRVNFYIMFALFFNIFILCLNYHKNLSGPFGTREMC